MDFIIKKKPEDYEITKYYQEKFKKTGILDCYQDVDLSNQNLISLPFNFGIIGGYFDCSNNKLTSLKGCPTRIDGGFYCHNNKLISLKECPTKIDGNFNCGNNKLTSIKGCPTQIDGDFHCGNNKLTSLEGFPTQISGDFYCGNNNFDIKTWIEIIEYFYHKDVYTQCDIVQNNSNRENTLKSLKLKQNLLNLINS